jgi:hypothetical protein
LGSLVLRHRLRGRQTDKGTFAPELTNAWTEIRPRVRQSSEEWPPGTKYVCWGPVEEQLQRDCPTLLLPRTP